MRRPMFLALLMALLLTACGGAPAATLPTPDANASAAQGSAPTAANAAPTVAAPANTAATPASASSQADTLRIGTPFLDQPFDPAGGGGFNAVQFGIGETLMRLDTSFAPQPWLAERLTP